MAPTSQNYSTDQQGLATNGHFQGVNETDPLLSKSTSKTSSHRFKSYMNESIDIERGDIVLLLAYVITGLVDGSAVCIWGAFASMQTGNTIYLGLGLADPSSGNRWIKSALSISCFCLGAAGFAWFHRFGGPRKRWVLILSYLVQTLFIIAAAVIVTLDGTTGADKDKLRWQGMLPLAMVAVGSSGQALSSRVLEKISLTSVVLTVIYCDLFSDPRLLSLSSNPERNQRLAAPACALVGALAGGFWARSEWGLQGALWTAVILKTSIVFAWTVWKKAEEEDGQQW